MTSVVVSRPAPSVVLELLKPITWFPPMWALGCGIVSSGVSPGQRWPTIIVGVLLAGPMVCGTSQAVNDWYDRHVDAINEPDRPIPSGRIPGRWGLYIAIVWTVLSLLIAPLLGNWGFVAAVVGLVLAWAYSAPPIRLKQNGWWGNAACGLCYEGLPWFTGAAVMSASAPDWRIVLIALLYSIGAHGIMTLNDFKSVEGDERMGIDSLPVLLGVDNAARFACLVMVVPQVAVVAMLLAWQQPIHAAAVGALVLVQLLLMVHFLKGPRERAPWYNGTGISCYVVGMLVSAFALAAMQAS
ncbi:chlorophyll synthase ChlG [Bradyrhizobium viridifuturi]|jgi:chlorophyll synthase|uniref:chlorophyll synthase ChlG n=1 Tax=Bradyrhizobium TaxID=374 RepID=UPI0003976E21|nr:chlorophyll synthase ChlG [Bradyrhizobium viridifuturi]ERF83840.1 MAG: bacteriochlorophyll/chlorophyll synthetase [Bradyrhizobium sp. DFCI-1]MCA3796758.1 chlorophyll synthase ChlG [Burkholderia sp.]OYU63377.1 MAG: bacteriochlorophyll/chlorophyll a synthase [Bradyrhizobium sp. PARBB1]PSO14289.1 chlorophyll synthase ChlG [Bradyrhizobium sp. MOS004]QRI71350.1 chlorophyll synthase ChlG [Bradyrhizobium sp. PSBB068]HAQ83642.1 chlorophyll synthase ChlG [Bradyrhizobium sp.]